MNYYGAKTLIVVYKDEMLVNQLKKFVETNDDNKENIVGTADGSINIVSWDENTWIANKKAGNIKDKVLFIGDIKGVENLIPVLDIRFDNFGVKFGWAGNQAVVFTEVDILNSRDKYLEFIEKLEKLPVPDVIKQPQNTKINVSENDESKEIVNKEDPNNNRIQNILSFAKDSIAKGLDVVEKATLVVASKTEDLFRDKNIVKRQMLFYGVANLYQNGLNDFMDA